MLKIQDAITDPTKCYGSEPGFKLKITVAIRLDGPPAS